MSGGRSCDVAVVGGGMAGLQAARIVAEAGLRVVLFEASPRLGGRVWTIPGPDAATPIELGAEFVHGKPEPTLRLAREAGVELAPFVSRHFIASGDSLQELTDLGEPLESVVSRLEPNDPDVSVKTFLEQHGIDADTSERVRQVVEGYEAAPIDELGIRSLLVDAEAMSSDEGQSRVVGGYGRLSEFLSERALAAGTEVLRETPVSHVKWQLNGPVFLSSPVGELSARACIVAVPLPLLQTSALDSGGVRFEPSVGAWRVPLEQLGMGHACRVSFVFRSQLNTGKVPRDAFVRQPSAPFEGCWCEETGEHMRWTLWAGGPKARGLARESAAIREKLALGSLATLFGATEASLREACCAPPHQHDFANDPWIRGAYSFCRPGGARASAALSVPIGDALFLAGEATDHEYPGTVAGALLSGERAARQVLAALR